MEAITEDLKKRKLKLVAVICETEGGKLQLISYSRDGLVSHISEMVEAVNVSEHLGPRAVRPMVVIGPKQ
jgi:hypothetical protein